MQVPDAPASWKKSPGIASAWLLAGTMLCILYGAFLCSRPSEGLVDFKAVYYGAQCLLHHCDPYNPAEFINEFQAAGGSVPSGYNAYELRLFGNGAFVCINLPTALLLAVPLALLPWKLAYVVWMLLTASSLALAAWLMSRVAWRYSLALSLLLVCTVLLNTQYLFVSGNLAGIAVSLCIVAAWCFVEEQLALVGVLCMAVSLALKPHDAGLVWLYFLLAGGAPRKRALQSLTVVAILAVPAVLWVSHVAPNWAQELHANLLAGAARGNINDPGPAAPVRSPGSIVSMQSVISLIRDDPAFYNAISYILCGALLLAGAIKALRTRFTRENAWLALAAISALSMLPVYHRLYDAKLLLLMVPACAMLWTKGGRLKWSTTLLTAAIIVVNADIPSAVLLLIANSLHAQGMLATLALRRPFALMLLASGIFYLWIYLKSDRLLSDPVEKNLCDMPVCSAATVKKA